VAHGAEAGRRVAIGGVTLRTVGGAVAAAVLAGAALGACSSKGSSSPSAGSGSSTGAVSSGITVDAVHAAAAKLGSAGGDCPLGLDVNAALKAAGVSGTAAPDTQNGPAADGLTPETSDGNGPPKQYSFSMIECSYVVTDGGTTTGLAVRLGAMPAGKGDTVANLLGPRIASDGRLSTADLRTFLSTSFTAGQSKVTPGAGTAVYSQLTGSGSGVGIEVSSLPPDNTATPALSGTALEKVTTTLAGQVHV
jgi:hypothetical protein